MIGLYSHGWSHEAASGEERIALEECDQDHSIHTLSACFPCRQGTSATYVGNLIARRTSAACWMSTNTRACQPGNGTCTCLTRRQKNLYQSCMMVAVGGSAMGLMSTTVVYCTGSSSTQRTLRCLRHPPQGR